jgi:hypothetical protein
VVQVCQVNGARYTLSEGNQKDAQFLMQRFRPEVKPAAEATAPARYSCGFYLRHIKVSLIYRAF